jgi:hypothetical protein
MTVWVAGVAFVTVVAILAVLNSGRTRGRSCCAPADPAADLRMRGGLDDRSTSDGTASRDQSSPHRPRPHQSQGSTT